ncbi:deoxyribonuclease IV [Parachlamydia sp. AcF125]|uniref:deoxyribonuclease IV n=1 Tax=Parachlamydia sp. AcF125 TaxID=2795736 RepID=UPI001BC96828|nr:deoxyribonuclease IV [Parachlamydia sp. AcF125]MBS4169283.1 Endonuclease 4 [Parachlamydia sp. AcF125]
MKTEKLWLGAHTSAAGGVQNALLEGKQIGASIVQLFTSNQKRWEGKVLGEKEIQAWQKALEETGIEQVMSHDSYLINLGSPNGEVLEKSKKAFREEAIRCQQLGISYLNFHPGAALQGGEQQCLDCICESLIGMQDLLENSSTRLLLEATAGQGSAVGWRFEHLAYIINQVQHKLPIGVCIDTCHIFAAGYDIRTPAAWNATLEEFDRVVGLNHLYAFHLNDSAKGLGSRVDRHQPLGKGQIGIESFQFLMKDSRTKDLPKYLETPGGTELWEVEIQMLQDFAKHPSSRD